MARRKDRKKAAPVDPEEKARIKKMRALQRREARKLNKESKASEPSAVRSSTGPLYSDPTWQKDDYEWLRRSMARSYAEKILQDKTNTPYWLSIPHTEGVEPVAHFYPCKYFRTKTRVYYGFMFQEHRDMVFANWREDKRARKELRDNVLQARSPNRR